jgi:hypothetical protein
MIVVNTHFKMLQTNEIKGRQVEMSIFKVGELCMDEK